MYEIFPVLGGRVVQQLMSRYDGVQLGGDVRHLDTDYSPGRLAMKHYISLSLSTLILISLQTALIS